MLGLLPISTQARQEADAVPDPVSLESYPLSCVPGVLYSPLLGESATVLFALLRVSPGSLSALSTARGRMPAVPSGTEDPGEKDVLAMLRVLAVQAKSGGDLRAVYFED